MVSPDAGGVERARAMAKRLDAGLAVIDKRRPEANRIEGMTVVGDVKGREGVMDGKDSVFAQVPVKLTQDGKNFDLTFFMVIVDCRPHPVSGMSSTNVLLSLPYARNELVRLFLGVLLVPVQFVLQRLVLPLCPHGQHD